MDKPFPYFHLTTGNMIFLQNLIIIVLLGLVLSFLSYTTQIRDIYLESNNASITAANENTERIMAQVDNSTNQTKTLITYLTDNFGEESGYLERENFQYAADNASRLVINATLNRVGKLLDNASDTLENQEAGKQRQLAVLAGIDEIKSLLNGTR